MESADHRPDPDELLATIIKDEEKSKRGKLKIFFGMCAGVGKTYTMLQAAKVEKAKGCDIIIGFVETHNRKETASLAEGFETDSEEKTGIQIDPGSGDGPGCHHCPKTTNHSGR